MVERICTADGCGRRARLVRNMCPPCYRRWLASTPKDERGLPPRFQSRRSEEFWAQVEKTHEYGCWVWKGKRNPKGYGRWGKHYTHRYSWSLANGAIPQGLWILHHCDNPPCVNPAHLYLGTVVENARDAVARGRVHRPERTQRCPQGHAKSGDNLSVVISEGRPVHRCRACENARSREYQRELRRAKGVVSQLLTDEEKERIRALSRDGMPQRKIAVEVGRGYATVQRVLRQSRRIS